MPLDKKTKVRPTNTLHHRRRSGTHRKQTKTYLQAYWPYLPLLGLAAIIVVFGGLHYMGLSGAVIGGSGIVVATVAFAL